MMQFDPSPWFDETDNTWHQATQQITQHRRNYLVPTNGEHGMNEFEIAIA
jgi:hypothetical protein